MKQDNLEIGESEKTRALTLLQQEIRQCRRCQEQGYLQQAHPIVSGRASDRILVIGQAPGHRSIAKDRPFSGPGGRILQKWLEQAGFPPGYLHEHCYLSSLTRCDPGKNLRGNGDRRPSRPELALCRPYLEAEIQLLQPQIVLLVGTMAIETFLVPYPPVQYPPRGSLSAVMAPGDPLDSILRSPKKSSAFALRKITLEQVIGTYQERGNSILLPLPHPSGVSRWLNAEAHQQQLQQALTLLNGWRQRFSL